LGDFKCTVTHTLTAAGCTMEDTTADHTIFASSGSASGTSSSLPDAKAAAGWAIRVAIHSLWTDTVMFWQFW
jgi:hypothetical protein